MRREKRLKSENPYPSIIYESQIAILHLNGAHILRGYNIPVIIMNLVVYITRWKKKLNFISYTN